MLILASICLFVFLAFHTKFENVHQAVSVLQQVTGALAAAEQELEFEHRDLHWGNVLVRKTKDDHVTVIIDGEEVSVESHGLHVSIIDFTLSRLQKGRLIDI